MDDSLRTAVDAQDSGGPIAQLYRLAAAHKELAREQSAQVRAARSQGYSWQAIATALEISKQAAHKKYGRQ
ncbi:AsnC family protein [Glutamicibacter sp.]|uniref:AsnC family protein n=1 Tax=Glutamicibacter sp. TaxID=1931995 RepID=UPI0028BF1A50|nr:AsnC family protein [Glutamicibacter sp.]